MRYIRSGPHTVSAIEQAGERYEDDSISMGEAREFIAKTVGKPACVSEYTQGRMRIGHWIYARTIQSLCEEHEVSRATVSDVIHRKNAYSKVPAHLVEMQRELDEEKEKA
jgi:hypothetical protein